MAPRWARSWYHVGVKSGYFGQQVNSDIRLQTVEIQMRRLLMSRLIRIFTVWFVNSFFIPMIKIWIKQGRCPNLPDVRSYTTLPYSTYGIIGSSDPRQCVDTPFLAAHMNGTQISIWASTWDFDILTKAQSSLCKCADSQKSSRLWHQWRQIAVLFRISWYC